MGIPEIPAAERSSQLKTFVFSQAKSLSEIKKKIVMEDEKQLFPMLILPWSNIPGISEEQKKRLEEKQSQMRSAWGFDGEVTAGKLAEILSEDKHLRECCVNVLYLAIFLGRFIISPLVKHFESNAQEVVIERLWREFVSLTYRRGRFQKLAYCHLFNFTSKEKRLDFGSLSIYRLEPKNVAYILGEITETAFLHPENVGNQFVVIKEGGPSEDLLGWLNAKVAQAEEFVRVLQYFKDGVVHIDYSVPHFQPPWVNQVRKLGLFFVGTPRRLPYENGRKFYNLDDDAEIQRVKDWWRHYTSDSIVRRMGDSRNQFRQTILRAGQYYETSLSRNDAVERLIALAIALESLLTPKSAMTEVTYRISQTAAQLVGKDEPERKAILKAVKTFYGRRSDLFHGRYNVEEYAQNKFVTHEQIEEWSSIVRRTILRFIILYLNGENDRESFLQRISESALDEKEASTVRANSDPDVYLEKANASAGTATR